MCGDLEFQEKLYAWIEAQAHRSKVRGACARLGLHYATYGHRFEGSELDALAYMALRMPSTVAVLSRLLTQLFQAIPLKLFLQGNASGQLTLFDWGAGPLTTLWALQRTLEDLSEETLSLGVGSVLGCAKSSSEAWAGNSFVEESSHIARGAEGLFELHAFDQASSMLVTGKRLWDEVGGLPAQVYTHHVSSRGEKGIIQRTLQLLKCGGYRGANATHCIKPYAIHEPARRTWAGINKPETLGSISIEPDLLVMSYSLCEMGLEVLGYLGEVEEATHLAVPSQHKGLVDGGQVRSGASRMHFRRGFEWPCGDLSSEMPIHKVDKMREEQEGAEAISIRPKAMVLVEPGTPQGYATLMQARARALLAGYHIIAPCTHRLPCPITSALSEGEEQHRGKSPGGRERWCHFGMRRPRTSQAKYYKEGALGYEDERFSYLICIENEFLQRQRISDTEQLTTTSSGPAPHRCRVIDHPRVGGGCVHLGLCTSEGIARQQIITRTDKPRFKVAKKLRWGDLYNL